MGRLALGLCVISLLSVEPLTAQEPAAPQTVPPAELRSAIEHLGDLDYTVRTNAARTVRRVPAAQAVPALLQAVSDLSDGYARYRALVLLTGFNDPRTTDAMRESLGSPNDRLRTVAYSFFEHHPDPAMIPQFLMALDKEQADFVRPALVRALAAQGGDARVQQALVGEIGRGQDFFRSVVIEALGEYKAAYALDAIVAIARLDGPLVDDAAIAIGRIGDKRDVDVLANLQRSAPKNAQPSVATAICLLGVNCESHEGYLIETLKFANETPGYQELLRGSASGLGALGGAGHADAVDALFDVGIPSRDPARAPIALALGTVALRQTSAMLAILGKRSDRGECIGLLSEGFDMLEEDLDKERFFATVRRLYWDAPEDSPSRRLMQTLIQRLDF